MKQLALLAAVLVGIVCAQAQDHPYFNVSLRLDYASANQTLEIYQGLSGHPDEVARLRGS